MAKRAMTLQEIEGGEGDEFEDLAPEEQDTLRALGELEGANEARWQVWRLPPLPPGTNKGFLGELTTAELSIAELQLKYGKGRYQIKGFLPNGRYLKSTRLEIANDLPSADVKASATLDTSGLDFMQMMQEREERRSERNRELMLAVVPGAITAVAGIFTAMLTRQQPQQNILQDVATLKTVLGRDNEQPTTLETVFKALELGMKNAGGHGSETNWVDVVKEVASSVGPALLARAPLPHPSQVPLNAGHPAAAPTPAAAPQLQAPGVAQTPEQATMLQLLNWARSTLAMLAKKAAANADPSLYADWVLDNLPDGVDIAPFIQYLQHKDWWQYLQQFSGAVSPYEGWFAEFRELLLDAIEQQHAPVDETVDEPENSINQESA